MQAQPQKQHQWLQQLLGEWTGEGQVTMGPDLHAERRSGTAFIRALGDLWIVADIEEDAPDGTQASSILTLGYDPERGRFVGSWVGSMMAHFWVYEGQLDPSGKVLSLETEGPGMTPGSRGRYRDVINVESDDHWTLNSFMLDDEGQWQRFMSIGYQRVT